MTQNLKDIKAKLSSKYHEFLNVFNRVQLSWEQDSSVHDVDYESFDSILCSNRSQKSQEISIRRSSNDVRTLRDQKSHHAEFSLMQQHSF